MDELFGLFTLGIFYGFTVCSLTCLPLVGPYVLGTGENFKDGLQAGLFFGIGRLASYTALGGLAALIGGRIEISPQVRIVMGMLLIVIALVMPQSGNRTCVSHKKRRYKQKRASLIGLGTLTTLQPCLPLASVFLLAAQHSVVMGMLYGFLFGCGLLVSPFLLLCGGLSFMAARLRAEIMAVRPFLRWGSMTIMVLLGVKMMVTSNLYGGGTWIH